MSKHADKAGPALPSEKDILKFLEETDDRVTKREIARAFQIKGADRATLRRMLKKMLKAGVIARDPDKTLRPAGALPGVGVVEVTGTDEFGDPVAKLVSGEAITPPPRIYINTGRRSGGRISTGQRILARLSQGEDEDGIYYDAHVIRILESVSNTVLGIYKGGSKGGRLTPTDRKIKRTFRIEKGDEGDARDGDLVLAEPVDQRRGQHGREQRVRVIENMGSMSEPRAISLIAIHHHGIPVDFPDSVLREAEKAKEATMEGREDLRHLPFVTIDPADARDHDDAILAMADDNPDNKGGWRILVAIADVAYYVRPGSPLDEEARRRGNSCYFPDRVVNMLPERLSADLCSLHEDVDRPVMVADMRIDAHGHKRDHRFYRAVIQSRISLNYNEVQEAYDGITSERTSPWTDTVIRPAYEAYFALKKWHKSREPLDLDLPERKIILSEEGEVQSVTLRERFDSHKLVEEFMILANVAAAETVEHCKKLCMYRVHEEPGFEKIEELREFLEGVHIPFAKGQVIRPRTFNAILRKVQDTPIDDLVNQVILRSQTQAYYSPDNQGHFGLALPKYAHFTSPIRRYSDILVHRAIIEGMKLGPGGLGNIDLKEFRKIGEEISNTERRAMAAERESNDRYLAAFLSARVGETFKGLISGVTRFGLFISLHPSGADGFIPISTLHADFFHHDDVHHRLVGKRSGIILRLGDNVKVRLTEADKITGSLRLDLLEAGEHTFSGPQGAGKRKKHGRFKKHKRKKRK